MKRSHFIKVRDLLERVFEKKNDAESKAADAYLKIVPDAFDMFTEKKDKTSETPPSPSRSRQSICAHSAWKDERIHFEKASSRVGPEFQVDVLPAAGSYYTSTKTSDVFDGGDL